MTTTPDSIHSALACTEKTLLTTVDPDNDVNINAGIIWATRRGNAKAALAFYQDTGAVVPGAVDVEVFGRKSWETVTYDPAGAPIKTRVARWFYIDTITGIGLDRGDVVVALPEHTVAFDRIYVKSSEVTKNVYYMIFNDHVLGQH